MATIHLTLFALIAALIVVRTLTAVFEVEPKGQFASLDGDFAVVIGGCAAFQVVRDTTIPELARTLILVFLAVHATYSNRAVLMRASKRVILTFSRSRH